MPRDDAIAITWLGHSAFRIAEPAGCVLLIDPWLSRNPSCPPAERIPKSVGLILVTHGHADHAEDAAALAREHGADVVAPHELARWLASQGAPEAHGMNKGGTIEVRGVRVTMVHADHSSGVEADERFACAGEPVGYVVRFACGLSVYHAGDTALFGDMRLIQELYEPDVAMLPIGDRYTMGPREAARACRILRPRAVFPMHYGTFPELTGTVEEFRAELRAVPGVELLAPRPGETVVLQASRYR